MEVIAQTKDFQIKEPTVVTIGKFDGRHKGHQKLLGEMLSFRKRHGYKMAVFTFAMTPAGVVSGQKQQVITTTEERRRNMEKMKLDYLVEYPFDLQVAHMQPEEFVKKILKEQMNAKIIVAGTDCAFGFQRRGNAELLEKLASVYDYEAVIIQKEQEDHRDISSTYIREELSKGNIEKANKLLGEPYSIGGVVVHGNRIGAPVLGFPTANLLPPPEKFLPQFGVYISQVKVDGKFYGGISNIGRKPTITGKNPVGVETFILKLEPEMDLYGKNIEVQFLHFQRPEQKFSGLEELKEQIERDKKAAVAYFEKNCLPEDESPEM